jgi:hypothetical protein
MEYQETPNEKLISSEDSKPQNNKFDIKFFILNNENNSQTDEPPIIINNWCKNGVLSLIIILFLGMFISSVLLIKKYLDTSDTLFIIYTIIIIYFVSFIIIIICAICGKKYVFSKDIQKNKFYIKRFNFFNKLILDLELSLGNYYIKCEELISQTSDGCSYTYYIIKVYNQINDTSEINLDITNIKEVPIKFIYILIFH